MTSPQLRIAATLACVALGGCAAGGPEMRTVDYVDLERFAGDWYVLASIPTFLEDEAYNAVERYDVAADGTIETTFTFRDGDFDGPLRTYTPKGFVRDTETNAEWGMQFVWPIKADYRIVYLNRDYTQTIIGRRKRDHVWIMARDPEIPEADYQELVERVENLGYDTALLRRVPQQW